MSGKSKQEKHSTSRRGQATSPSGMAGRVWAACRPQLWARRVAFLIAVAVPTAFCCGIPIATAAPQPTASSASLGVSGSVEAGAPTAVERTGPINPFVIPSVQTLDSGQQAGDVALARHESAAAWIARQRSQTAYTSLNPGQAAALASESFPEEIRTPAAPPRLPEGAKVASYPTDNAAVVTLASGQSGIVESTTPLAVQTASGTREAVDLSLYEDGAGFQPARSPADVAIAKSVGAGTALPASGVALVPTDRRGHPLAGTEGKIDGAAVFYAATGPSIDSAVKPTAFGFEADTILRSPSSPRTIYYKVTMPHGARLVHDGRTGAIAVTDQGATLATVEPPAASDASGWPVPVAMRTHGDLVELRVGGDPVEQQYPLVIDPEVHERGRFCTFRGWFEGFQRVAQPCGYASSAASVVGGGSRVAAAFCRAFRGA